jgi:DNA-binding ferritin-like protein
MADLTPQILANTQSIQQQLGQLGPNIITTLNSKMNDVQNGLGWDMQHYEELINSHNDDLYSQITKHVDSISENIVNVGARIDTAVNDINSAITTLNGMPDKVATKVVEAMGSTFGNLSDTLDLLRRQLISTMEQNSSDLNNNMYNNTVLIVNAIKDGNNKLAAQESTMSAAITQAIANESTRLEEDLSAFSRSLTSQLTSMQNVESELTHAVVLFLTDFWDNVRKFYTDTQTVDLNLLQTKLDIGKKIGNTEVIVSETDPVKDKPSAGTYLAELENPTAAV